MTLKICLNLIRYHVVSELLILVRTAVALLLPWIASMWMTSWPDLRTAWEWKFQLWVPCLHNSGCKPGMYMYWIGVTCSIQSLLSWFQVLQSLLQLHRELVGWCLLWDWKEMLRIPLAPCPNMQLAKWFPRHRPSRPLSSHQIIRNSDVWKLNPLLLPEILMKNLVRLQKWSHLLHQLLWWTHQRWQLIDLVMILIHHQLKLLGYKYCKTKVHMYM